MARLTPHIQIKKQNRKSLAMRVTPSGDVVVMIPNWLKPSHPQVKRFIKEGLKKLDEYLPVEKPEPLHNAATVRRLARKWAGRVGVEPGRVQIRPMTRKWGSCSSKGNITFNTALYYVPFRLVEYVIVHELVHMLIFDHSLAFWQKLGEYLPDYQALEQELNQYRV